MPKHAPKAPPKDTNRNPGRTDNHGQGNPTCTNGHTANKHGQCFESTCPNYVRKGL